ncbi:MAG TPA: CTP synthase [Pyrinomonadaceae bacterium]|jgi:CTP synthase (UTP-ammonia lyase)
MAIKLGLIGDYSPDVVAHIAIPKALSLAAEVIKDEVNAVWLGTETVAEKINELSEFDALWCVPASPYKNMDGALSAIRYARESKVPFLGTCGGFQHALIEYARNVLNLKKADHGESNPQTEMPLIAPLACSLVEARGVIKLEEDSRINRIYGCREIYESYHCSYGFNPRYKSILEQSEMEITGVDENGDPRVLEIKSHPFFISTLFQPERSSLTNSSAAHPLVRAFLEAAASNL